MRTSAAAMTSAPTSAPARLSSPPTSAAGKAFSPSTTMVPSSPASQAISMPAMPPVKVASPQAMAYTPCRPMPRCAASSGFWPAARIRMPQRDRRRNANSAA